MRSQARRVRTVDQYMVDELRQPKLWLGGFVVALFAILFVAALFAGAPLS